MAARTEIPILAIPEQGAVVVSTTAGDAANGMQLSNEGNTLLLVKNDDAAPKTATVVSIDDPQFGRKEDLVRVIAAGSEELMGPFLPSIWNQPGGKIFLDLDADTSVFVSAIRYSPRK